MGDDEMVEMDIPVSSKEALALEHSGARVSSKSPPRSIERA